MTDKQPESIFARRGWLSAQPDDFRAAVVKLGQRRRFNRGEFLHYEGDSRGGIYGILSGGLGVVQGRRDGASILTTIVRPGTWIGEAPLQSGGKRVVSLRATELTDVLYVALRDLDKLAGSEPDVRRRYGWLLLFNTQHALQAMSDLQIQDSGRRLAATLLRVTAVTEGVEPDHPDGFQITQSELGEMANVSRNRVNRVLSDFAKQDWVTVRYSHIRVINPTAIELYVSSGAS